MECIIDKKHAGAAESRPNLSALSHTDASWWVLGRQHFELDAALLNVFFLDYIAY